MTTEELIKSIIADIKKDRQLDTLTEAIVDNVAEEEVESVESASKGKGSSGF